MIKKGFTLIELLAVIIILAIVALIATPIILNVIEDARISAGRSEASMIYTGINNYCATEDMKYQLDNSYSKICTSSMNPDTVRQMVNLGNAGITSVSYDGTKLTNLVVISNNHTFTLCGDGSFAMDDEECGVAPEDPDVGLVGDTISDTVLTQFPYLATIGNGCTTPNDNNYSYMGGCYLKGNPNNNYIWYSGFLWRIMGINADGTIRMIVDENITAIPWGASNADLDYDESYVKDWLNDYFYNRLKNNDIIVEQIWCSETTGDDMSTRTTCTNNSSTELAKIGLITLDEYNLGGGVDSYLNLNQDLWTITPSSNSSAWYIYNDGYANSNIIGNASGVRAVINVKADTLITGGNGIIGTTWNNTIGPYILNENKNIDSTGKLNEAATSGEYVLYAGKKYRVVDIDNNGNIKLILDSYYEEIAGTTYTIKFGNDNNFSTTTGIGQKLNTDILEWLVPSSNTNERNKLLTNYMWYQNAFNYGDDYKIALEEENPTRSVEATVGLIRVGEMLSSHSSSILTNNYTTVNNYNNVRQSWTITQYQDDAIWDIYASGIVSSNVINANYAVRPVIVINSNVNIISGTGTWSNPYQI